MPPAVRLAGNVLGAVGQVLFVVGLFTRYEGFWRWPVLVLSVVCLLGFYRGAGLAVKAMTSGTPDRTPSG